MAEEFYRNLGAQLIGLSSSISTNSVANIIEPYKGDPKLFKEWIKNIEKYCVLATVSEDRVKLVAFQSSRGVVSHFIQRKMMADANLTWDALKQDLINTFSEITDTQQALAILAKIRQKPEENVQVFAERILSLAAEAFPGYAGQREFDRQLINFFVDGLQLENIKTKILRDDPQTFVAAVDLASQEQNIRKRFALRLGGQHTRVYTNSEHEPMDVDYVRNRTCGICFRRGHVSRECRQKRGVNEVKTSFQGNTTCWFCGVEGHFKRDCRKFDDYLKSNPRYKRRDKSVKPKTPHKSGN
ncbi:hypothetical protein SNE40_021811 [Patella caerulea]|uniref:CCHC-type domain-containing protein n=1 Tax=Patella caerulea TaxID=87958 RepID=A0AAN8IY99_PATCE